MLFFYLDKIVGLGMRLPDEGGQMTISKLLSEIKTTQGALLWLWHKISMALQLSSCCMLFPFPEVLVWGPGMCTQTTCQQIPHNNKHGTDWRGMNYSSSDQHADIDSYIEQICLLVPNTVSQAPPTNPTLHEHWFRLLHRCRRARQYTLSTTGQ